MSGPTVPLRVDSRVVAWRHPDDAERLRAIFAGGVTFGARFDNAGRLAELAAYPLAAKPKDFQP